MANESQLSAPLLCHRNSSPHTFDEEGRSTLAIQMDQSASKPAQLLHLSEHAASGPRPLATGEP